MYDIFHEDYVIWPNLFCLNMNNLKTLTNLSNMNHVTVIALYSNLEEQNLETKFLFQWIRNWNQLLNMSKIIENGPEGLGAQELPLRMKAF